MSMIAKREMIAAAKRLAKTTNSPTMASDLQAIMNGVNTILKEYDMEGFQLKLVKVTS